MRGSVPARLRALLVAWLAGTAIVLATRGVRANYESARITRDDVRIAVEATGLATIAHTLIWKVVAGQPHSLELAGVAASADLTGPSALTDESGRVIPAALSWGGQGALRVTVLDPKAIRHGQEYRVDVSYRENLLERGDLVRDGERCRLTWHGAALSSGYDSAKQTFVLPPAPAAPTIDDAAGVMPDDGTTARVTRFADRDEIELTRPHVGALESPVWAVSASAAAFEETATAGGRPPALTPIAAEPPRVSSGALAVLALLSALFALAVRGVEARLARRAPVGRPLAVIPVAGWERAALAGALLFVGASLQLGGAAIIGAAVVCSALLAASLSPPPPSPDTRGPGVWAPLHPAQAFEREDRIGARVVRVALPAAIAVVAIVAFVVAGFLVAGAHPEAHALLAVDVVVALPLVSWDPRENARAGRACRSRAALAVVYRDLAKSALLQVCPVGHVSAAGTVVDELRVHALPHHPVPGLLGIEVCLETARNANVTAYRMVVKARVMEGTAAEARVVALHPAAAVSSGRNPTERIVRMASPTPGRRDTVRLVRELSTALVERRVVDIAAEATPHREQRRRASSDGAARVTVIGSAAPPCAQPDSAMPA
jgi:hypothetical protein